VAETVAEGEPDPDGDPDVEGLSVLLVGLAGDVGADADALAVDEALGEGDEALGEGDEALGEGDEALGEGDGDDDGDGELAAGSGWQVVLVSWADAAWALAGQAASAPEISKPPPSELSIVARTCAKRIYLALSALLVLLTALLVIRRHLGNGWVLTTHIRPTRHLCMSSS
jgi:hypothetical protein